MTRRTMLGVQLGRPRRYAVIIVATAVLLSSCSGSSAYDGPGIDHRFVGRSLSEVEPCDTTGCGSIGMNLGTLDGVVVRVVTDVSEDGQQFADLACSGDRVNLVVDGDTIVAAVQEDCS